MDKGKQPNIWGRHNLNQLAGEVFRRNEEKEKAQAVGKILAHPDHNEENVIGILSDNALSHLHKALGRVFEVKLYPSRGAYCKVNAKLFHPHECVTDNSCVIPVKVSTSVVAFDTYTPKPNGQAEVRVGSVLLFKLSANLINESAPDINAKDLAWGENCTYGALVDGDAINYFEITQTSGDVVQSELCRKDPTEEDGQSVEMQVVKPGQDRLIVNKLSPSSDEAFELEQELDKFIASHSAQ